jgi:ribonucleotide monophosphatase NagD (HAD superfamily)
VLPLNESAAAEVLVIADQAGFDCLEVMDQALSLIMQRFDSGQALALVLCNPDLIYPRGAGRFGFTAGALAAMLEALIEERYAALNAGFVRLGKPYEPIFREALHRTGKGRAVMFGDQLATDILGAQRAGIDSVWVRTGLGSGNSDQTAVPPTWQLSNLVCDRQVTDG